MGRYSLEVMGPLAVNGLAQGIDYPADEPFAHRHGYHPAGALHGVALPDALIGTRITTETVSSSRFCAMP